MEQQNPLIKYGVTLLVIIVGLFVVVAVFVASKPTPPTPGQAIAPAPAAQSTPAPATTGAPAPAPQPGDATAPRVGAATTPAPLAPVSPATQAAASGPAGPSASAPPSTTPSPAAIDLTGLHAASQTDAHGQPDARVATLGSVDAKKSSFKLEVDLSAWGASVLRVRLADYRTDVTPHAQPLEIQEPLHDPTTGDLIFPYAARSIEVGPNHDRVDLANLAWQLRYPTAYRTTLLPAPNAPPVGPFDHAIYAATILNGHNQPVVEVIRTYTLAAGSYDVTCQQQLHNLTSQALGVTWQQNAGVDLPFDPTSYYGDVRRVVTGYYDPGHDPSRTFIYTRDAEIFHDKALEAIEHNKPLWPASALPVNAELAWVALRDRYFMVVTHPMVASGANGAYAVNHWFSPTTAGQWNDLDWMEVGVKNADSTQDTRKVLVTLATKPLEIPPGGQLDLSYGIFAGPLEPTLLAHEPFSALMFGQMVVYKMSSCSFCTFQWLAKALMWFLDGLHFVTFDWGISIIILVLVVRGVLHPITRKSQVNMMKMGKMTQQLAPELKRLKEKYKDDQAAYNREMWNIYKAKGVSPTSMLGCLPMLLQMPIWVALYAMLFYAIELRQQPAFYNIFHFLSAGKWQFLTDLSGEDKFWVFANHPWHPLEAIPLVGRLNFANLNALPVLMGVVYYIQQKFAPPMTAGGANPQSAGQQAMMKWMMVIMFPLMLYNAPAGLNLYILASTAASIWDSRLVRQHLKREEDLIASGVVIPVKQSRAGGLMTRLHEFLAEKQQQAQDQAKRRSGGEGGPPTRRRK